MKKELSSKVNNIETNAAEKSNETPKQIHLDEYLSVNTSQVNNEYGLEDGLLD